MYYVLWRSRTITTFTHHQNIWIYQLLVRTNYHTRFCFVLLLQGERIMYYDTTTRLASPLFQCECVSSVDHGLFCYVTKSEWTEASTQHGLPASHWQCISFSDDAIDRYDIYYDTIRYDTIYIITFSGGHVVTRRRTRPGFWRNTISIASGVGGGGSYVWSRVVCQRRTWLRSHLKLRFIGNQYLTIVNHERWVHLSRLCPRGC